MCESGAFDFFEMLALRRERGRNNYTFLNNDKEFVKLKTGTLSNINGWALPVVSLLCACEKEKERGKGGKRKKKKRKKTFSL